MNCTGKLFLVQFHFLSGYLSGILTLMRRIFNYIFLVLGLVYMISGLLLLFSESIEDTYTVFFGLELSKNGYVAYKTVIGALLVIISIIDLRFGQKADRK